MSDFQDFLEKAKDFFDHLLTEAGKIALSFLSAAAKSIAASGGALLVEAARNAVVAAEKQGGTGSEKREAAINAVTSTLENAGISVIATAVNTAIEAAVAEMNANK